jgi:acetyltransferase
MGPRPAIDVRPILPSDRDNLELFYADLSPASRHSRFLGTVRGMSSAQSRRFCTPDHDHREGFVAVVHGGSSHTGGCGPAGLIVGHVCVEPDETGAAEIAIAVADAYQRRGVGRRLMAAAMGWARHAGIDRFTATMFASNVPIQRLIQALGLATRSRPVGSGLCVATIEIPGRDRAAA